MSEQKVAELTQDVRKLKSDMQSIIWIFRGLASLGAVLVCDTIATKGGDPVAAVFFCWYLLAMISLTSYVFFHD